MNGADDPLDGLEHRLFDIPEPKFVEIVHLLEQIGDHPRVRETFQTIRPRLVQVRPTRRLTLKRVFCDPFEDVLEAARIGDVPVGRIDRGIIDPLWQVVEERGDPKHMKPLAQQVRTLAAHDAAARHALGCRLWYVASVTLRQALAEAEKDPRARRALLGGGDERLEQARQVLEFLEIGHPIADLKNRLPPKPIPSLEPEDVSAIESAVKEVARSGTGKPYYLLLTVASRLRKPAELLAVLGDMDFGKARREKPAVFATLSGLVVTSLEDHTARADGDDQVAQDPATAVTLAEHLVDSLESTRAVMDLVNETKYDGRLQAVRQAVRGMVETTVLTPAQTRIVESLPPPPTPGAAFAAPDDEMQMQAEDHARALRRCQQFAGALGLDHTVAETLAAIGKGVEKRLDRVIGSAAALPRTPDSQEAIEQSLIYAVRLVELVAGSNQADDLRLRATEILDGMFDPGV